MNIKPFYHNLMALTQGAPDLFSYKDVVLDSCRYRIFNYGMVFDEAEWLRDDALECRGHMFDITSEDDIRIKCRPFEKFFNLNENSFTRDLDLSLVERMETKADGSLISSFWHNNELRLKTRNSLDNQQSIQSLDWLLNRAPGLYEEVSDITRKGFTVNMEWIGPSNVVVIPYKDFALQVLSIRNNLDGAYWNIYDDENDSSLYPNIIESWVNCLPVPDDPTDLADRIRGLTDTEGVVLLMQGGQRVKVKTDWYRSLHSVVPKMTFQRLWKTVCQGESDDLKSGLDEPYHWTKIEWVEQQVANLSTRLWRDVKAFHTAHKGLTRKEYALHAKTQKDIFPLLMKVYGREQADVDVANFLLDKRFDKSSLETEFKQKFESP